MEDNESFNPLDGERLWERGRERQHDTEVSLRLPPESQISFSLDPEERVLE